MSAAAPAAPAAETDAAAKPKKSKKLLFIIIGVVVLALVGAGGALMVLKSNTADDEGEDGAHAEEADDHASASTRDPKTPPTFLPLDSMVVNLADPGGNRYAQLGITLQLSDSHAAEEIKTYMPTIRNGILILISQRTAEQMLRADGKTALTNDIVAEISDVMGYDYEHADEAAASPSKSKKKKKAHNPVEGVLFSSFIVQ